MNCRGWNPQIALYIEGDLEPETSLVLERHLALCDGCRNVADSLRESQSEVRQLGGESISEAAMSRVRANVLHQVRQIEASRTWIGRVGIWLWGGLRWRYAVSGVFAIMLLSVISWHRNFDPVASSPDREEARSVAGTAPPSAAGPSLAKRSVRARKPVERRGPSTEPEVVAVEASEVRVPAAGEVRESADTVVQIQTTDPNIVIYWLIDQHGGL